MSLTKDNKMVCDYCGRQQEKVAFWIGAPPPQITEAEIILVGHGKQTGFTMHEGTGKISCLGCREKGNAEAKAVIDKLIS